MAELDPGIGGRELPLDLALVGVGGVLPGGESVLRVSRSVMRRSRHWRVRTDSSISAMLSQERWRGVWWISSRCTGANAVAGSNAW